ncbi:MAG TPA: hypothetical protein PLB01_07095 [Thermoanaerobaculia bacterium]|nr:hypothetical protein [Thermoanaerobaculia bacterium]
MSDLAAAVLDRLGYLVVYAPDIPSTHELTLVRQFAQIQEDIIALITKQRREETRQQLEVAMNELKDAERAFNENLRDKGRQLIFDAERRVQQSLGARPPRTTFVSGPSGTKNVRG